MRNLAIDGSDPGADRPLWVTDASDVALDRVEIRNGSPAGGALVDRGSTLEAVHSTFRNNFAEDFGGAVHVLDATATFRFCTFADNEAYVSGGALSSNGTMRVLGSTFVDNIAVYGAGLECYYGADCVVRDSRFSGGIAVLEGGALSTYAVGTLEVTRSAFCDNAAVAAITPYDLPAGGAISVLDGVGDIQIQNNTFARNTANNEGGGLAVLNLAASVLNNTFDANEAASPGGASALFAASQAEYGTSKTAGVYGTDVVNNLFVDNGGAWAFGVSLASPEGGYNLYWGSANDDTNAPFASDLQADPMLAPAPAPCGVRAPMPGSPAIDGGDPALTDPDGSRSDIGATGGPEALEDGDGDGWDERLDCDDEDPEVSPDAAEQCDGRDNDCDGTTDEDCPPDPTSTTDPTTPPHPTRPPPRRPHHQHPRPKPAGRRSRSPAAAGAVVARPDPGGRGKSAQC